MENGGGGGGRGSCRRGGKLAANLPGGPGTTLVTTVCWAAGDNKCWTCDPAQCAQEDFTITELGPTRAFSWLKASIGVFTFLTRLSKTLC